jgi:hypothetical protein
MKKMIRLFFLSALATGILSSAQAGRGHDSNGRRGGSAGVYRSSSPSRSFSAPYRSMSKRSDPERSVDQRQQSMTSQRSAPERTSNSYRSDYTQNNATRNVSRANEINTPERNTTAYNTRVTGATAYNTRVTGATGVYNRTGNGGYYHYNKQAYVSHYVYHPYYGYVYGHRTVFMYGPHYAVIPASFISINFGGYPYYYNSGLFYGYYGGYYQPLFPPFGISVGVLPYGYSSLFIGGYPYYYYNGIYYSPNSNGNGNGNENGNEGYHVVEAPMGATVSSLPGGATSVVINGETLYELNGTYYKAGQDSNGNNVFTVVGKNGVINNTPNEQNDYSAPPVSHDQTQAPANNAPSLSNLNIGDTVGQLPDGSKLVNINGEQLYQTPDNVYLKGESSDGVVQFKVVGK